MDDHIPQFGLNVGRFIEHYRPLGWQIIGSPGGFGFTARRPAGPGRPRLALDALSLDELAAKIEAASA